MTKRLARFVFPVIVAMTFSVLTAPSISVPQTTQRSTWHVYVVDRADDVGVYNSIVVDTHGYPHISYSGWTDGTLKYAKWTGVNWSIEPVDWGWYSSIALDNRGRPCIGYAGHEGLEYARWTGGNWSIQVVDWGQLVGDGTSMVLDSGGKPHMSYHDYPEENLKYTKWTGANWSAEVVDANSYMSTFTSIALDGHGNPHISYYDSFNASLKYAEWTGQRWIIEVVDVAEEGGYDSSLALDSHGNPHIGYYDRYPNPELKHATRNGANWSIEVVDNTGWVGPRTSIALDSQDHPHIAYANWTALDLRYAEWTGSKWDVELVDSARDVGGYASIALDERDIPHISYYDHANGDLKYAAKTELGPLELLRSYSPTNLSFGTLPPGVTDVKSFGIWNSGGGTLTYSLSENVPWITGINPSGGSCTGEHDNITASIDTSGLSVGLHTGSVSIASNGGIGTVEVSVRIATPTRQIALDIDPDTLSLKSRGKWITAHLTFENASPADIDPPSLLLNDVVQPSWWDVQNGTTLMVKFDRAAVQAIVPVSDSVDIRVAGRWKDSGTFEVHDAVRVVNP